MLPPEDVDEIRESKLSMMPEDVKVGDRLQAESGENKFLVEVTAIEGDEVTLDANHPLAGKTLVFDVEIIGIDS